MRRHLWVLRRILFGVVVVFVVTLVIFLATHALPTDPAQAILGRNATPENLAAERKLLGLDKPLFTQYTSWLTGAVQGDLGISLGNRVPVASLLWLPLRNSLCLLFVVALLAIPLSILLGALTAIRRDRRLDRNLLLASLGLSALPEFVVGMTLVILLGTVVLELLPAVALFPADDWPLSHPLEIVLPVLTLVLAIVPYQYRQVRGSMIDVLESDYVAMARLKGMSERVVTWRHALPNALIPTIQASALTLAYLLGGVVVVEYLFNYPGLGSLLVGSVANRDLPLIEAVVLVFAAGVVLFNLIADVATVYVTPKLRTRTETGASSRRRRRLLRSRQRAQRQNPESGDRSDRAGLRRRRGTVQPRRRRPDRTGGLKAESEAEATIAAAAAVAEPPSKRRPPTLALLARAWRLGRTRLGLVLTVAIVGFALIGPYVAPHAQSDFVGSPYSGPTKTAPLGANFLGQDVLTQVLWGGRSILWMAVAAVTIGVAVGVALGLAAGYARNLADDAIMRTLDIQSAFPGLVFVLLFVSMLGRHLWLIVLLVAFGNVPGVARVTRGITTEAATREFVEAAEVLGVPRRRILLREILPNLMTPLMVEYTLRLTWAIGTIAALSFLGFGVQPPHTDWGLMINQNRQGLTLEPWAIVAPIICIAIFTIGTNLLGEGLSRAIAGVDGRSTRGRRRRTADRPEPVARRSARQPGRGNGRTSSSPTSLVEVRDLRVELTGTGDDVVDEISFTIEAGEVLGLVGESGSGKTTIGTALLGHARRGAAIVGGEVVVDGTSILDLSGDRLRQIRGSLVAYIPQDPTASLNPALRIERQLSEMLDAHVPEWSEERRRTRINAVLDEVKLPQDSEFLRRYPHQLSGGQQQRVAIAMAFILQPRLIVLDEPTTGLDVTTQAHVLETVRELCSAHGVAGLYVTHDLAVVANLADRVLVAYAGRLAELASRRDLFERPVHPYTRRLLATIPLVSERRALDPIPGQAPAPGSRPGNCFFAPRCSFALPICTAEEPPVIEASPGHFARCVRAGELLTQALPANVVTHEVPADGAEAILTVDGLSTFYGSRQILFGVSMSLRPNECLALVGESGSGKTTLARSIIGLATTWYGEIAYKGEPLGNKARLRPVEVRRELQYIFQSPYTSLNPRRSIEESIAMPLQHFFGLKGRKAREQVEWALESVSLPARFVSRYPDELSGGERQRVAIARALVCEPEVLICDEITSALDVSVQASIVRLLEELRQEYGLALLFVTHNLALVRSVADRVIVMENGRIVETGDLDDVLDRPHETYTRMLLANTPSLVPAGAGDL